MGKLSSSKVLSNSLIQTLNDLNNRLERHEKIKKIVVFRNQWTIENNFLTPTLKLKRNLIEQKNQSSYLSWYNEKEIVIFIE